MDCRPDMRCCKCGAFLGISPGDEMQCEKCGYSRPMTVGEQRWFGLTKGAAKESESHD